MKKYDIWLCPYWGSGMENTLSEPRCLATQIEASSFKEAVINWYNSLENPKENWGELSFDKKGNPILSGGLTLAERNIWKDEMFEINLKKRLLHDLTEKPGKPICKIIVSNGIKCNVWNTKGGDYWYEATNISDSLTWDNIVDQSPKDAKWAYLTDVFPVTYGN